MPINIKQLTPPIESPLDLENLSPVDEIRLVREALSAEVGQDINKLADHATAASVAWRDLLRKQSAK